MKGLSRVWGNLQARFLRGLSLAIGSGYQTALAISSIMLRSGCTLYGSFDLNYYKSSFQGLCPLSYSHAA